MSFFLEHLNHVRRKTTQQQPSYKYGSHNIREHPIFQHFIEARLILCRHLQRQRPVFIRRLRRFQELLCHGGHVRASLAPIPFQHFGVLLYRRYVVVQVTAVLRYRFRADVGGSLVNLHHHVCLQYLYRQFHNNLFYNQSPRSIRPIRLIGLKFLA